MLKFVLGGSGSGKTTLLYQRVKARAEAGQRSILLVPEQFTSSTEGRIYRELGDSLSGLVESFSFTSLAEKILSTEGGAAVQTLSDAGRTVLVRRALEELQDNVHYYYRHRRSAAFCQMAAETIDELKSAGLSGQQLYALARNCGTESGKLSELALIFQGYETLLAHTGMDPADRLELAADRLEAALAAGKLPEFLRDRAVFVDEFDTFNAPKKRLMGAMLAALPMVTVALCDDGTPLQPEDLSLFSGAKQVAAQLRQLARKNGAEVAVPELLRKDLRHQDAPALAAVTRLLETGRCEPLSPETAGGLYLFAAPSREEEARAAAGAIRRLMRQGVRCGKIAVVCRDIAKYPAPETTTRQNAAKSVEYKLDGLVRDEQKVFDAMDADETGRYLPFSFRNGAPSPYQKDKRADIAKLNRIELHLDDLVTRMGEQLYGGQIAAEPLVTGRSPCQWCDYGFICCHETGIGERALNAPEKPFEPEEKTEEEEKA